MMADRRRGMAPRDCLLLSSEEPGPDYSRRIMHRVMLFVDTASCSHVPCWYGTIGILRSDGLPEQEVLSVVENVLATFASGSRE